MEYRFVTATRKGKWYPSLKLAQEQACAIGAGYYDKGSEKFYKYRDSQLQVRRSEEAIAADARTIAA